VQGPAGVDGVMEHKALKGMRVLLEVNFEPRPHPSENKDALRTAWALWQRKT
jgi:hypothetical protein